MRTLTNSECRHWVKSQGLVWQPSRGGLAPAAQFGIDDARDGGAAARRAIFAACARASQALLVIDDHPLTATDRFEQLSQLRAAHGESRALADAPGHLLRQEDAATLASLLDICIGPGSWSSVCAYLAPLGTTLLLWESSLVDLWGKRGAAFTALAGELREMPTR